MFVLYTSVLRSACDVCTDPIHAIHECHACGLRLCPGCHAEAPAHPCDWRRWAQRREAAQAARAAERDGQLALEGVS